MKTLLIITTIVLVFGLGTAASAQNLFNSENWEGKYEGDVLPSAAGWSITNGGPIPDGKLEFSSESSDGNIYSFSSTTDWSGYDYDAGISNTATAYSIEFRARLTGGHPTIPGIVVHWLTDALGQTNQQLQFDDPRVRHGNIPEFEYPIDTSAWHTYRFTNDSGLYSLYIDNDPTPVHSAFSDYVDPSPTPKLTWQSWGAAGEVDWIRWTVGAFPIKGIGPVDFTWAASGSGDWNSLDGWTPAGRPGSGVSNTHQTVLFADSIGSETHTVFSNEGVTLNAINFANTMGGSYLIAGRPGISLIASTVDGGEPRLGVQAGSHEFQAPLSILNDTTADIASDTTLTLNNALNLMGNTLTKTGAGAIEINNILSTGGGTINVEEGRVSGSGTVGGDLNNNGVVAPGSGVVGGAGQVPEPVGIALLALGLMSLAVSARLRPNRFR